MSSRTMRAYRRAGTGTNGMELTLVAEVAVGGHLDPVDRQNLEHLTHGEEA